MLKNLRCYRLDVDNLNKLIRFFKNWSSDAKANCPREGDSIDDFLKEKMI